MAVSDEESSVIDPSGEMRPSRAAVLALAEVRYADQGVLGHVEDLSLGGIRLYRPGGFDLAEGDAVQVELRIPAEPLLLLEASVVRLEPEMVGFQFRALTPEVHVELERLLRKHGQLRDGFGIR